MKNKIKSEWNKIAKAYDQSVGEIGDPHHRGIVNPAVFKLLSNISGKKILDLGCGQGYIARKLAKKGAKVIAIDSSKFLLSIAEQKEKQEKRGIKYYLRNASKLSNIKSNYFDIILCNMALFDIANVKNTIKECNRVLKNKGNFIFSLTHPCFAVPYITNCQKQKRDKKIIFSRQVLKYYKIRKIKHDIWEGNKFVNWYHRPLSFYINLLVKNNLYITTFNELIEKDLHKNEKRFKNDYKYKKEYWEEIPSFLVIEAIKLNKL